MKNLIWYSDQYNQKVAKGLKVELEQEFGTDFSRPIYASKILEPMFILLFGMFWL